MLTISNATSASSNAHATAKAVSPCSFRASTLNRSLFFNSDLESIRLNGAFGGGHVAAPPFLAPPTSPSLFNRSHSLASLRTASASPFATSACKGIALAVVAGV
jgi:hypothetical protein